LIPFPPLILKKATRPSTSIFQAHFYSIQISGIKPHGSQRLTDPGSIINQTTEYERKSQTLSCVRSVPAIKAEGPIKGKRRPATRGPSRLSIKDPVQGTRTIVSTDLCCRCLSVAGVAPLRVIFIDFHSPEAELHSGPPVQQLSFTSKQPRSDSGRVLICVFSVVILFVGGKKTAQEREARHLLGLVCVDTRKAPSVLIGVFLGLETSLSLIPYYLRVKYKAFCSVREDDGSCTSRRRSCPEGGTVPTEP